MTALASRPPLESLAMNASSRPVTRRRSARLAFDENEALDPVKRSKRTVPENGSTQTAASRSDAARGAKKSVVERRTKTVYEEEEDGFQFSRAKSKRTKAPVAVAEDEAPQVPAAVQTKTTPEAKPKRQRRPMPTTPAAVAAEEKPVRRRSKRLSDEGNAEPATKSTAQPATAQPAKATEASRNDKALATGRSNDALRVEKRRDTTRIALPFADTPINKRNKQMRDGHRRSSTGMRGRRASSLIDSGTSNAVPHAEVSTSEFYKHIAQDMPEPRRMKQLLTWCAARALPDKPTGEVEDSSAIMAARVIQSELLQEFSSRSELCDWFSRDDNVPSTVTKIPNPRNIQNAAKLEELERDIARLDAEKERWEALLRAPALPSQSPPAESTPTTTTDTHTHNIDASLLDEDQAAILASLTTDSSSATTNVSTLHARLDALDRSLDLRIDTLADGVHRLTQWQAAAGRLADHALATTAKVLGEDHEVALRSAGTQGTETRDVLRALSRVIR